MAEERERVGELITNEGENCDAWSVWREEERDNRPL
jgi:hypothetical protein